LVRRGPSANLKMAIPASNAIKHPTGGCPPQPGTHPCLACLWPVCPGKAI